MKLILGFILGGCVMLAQDLHDMVNLDALKSKAEDSVEVNLDGNLLKMAMGFLSDKDAEEAQVKKLIGGIKGIYVRSLTFDKPGMYSAADVDKIRAAFKGPQWAKVVSKESKRADGDNVGVFIKTDGTQMQGLVVLDFEPYELTIVNIVGVIDPAQVRSLEGKLGIPMIWDDDRPKKRKADKDEEEE